MTNPLTPNQIQDFFVPKTTRDVLRVARLQGESSKDRITRIALMARDIISAGVNEAISELAISVEGFDLSKKEDQADYLAAIQYGGVLAAIDVGNADENAPFFTALQGANEEVEGYDAIAPAAGLGHSSVPQIAREYNPTSIYKA